VDDTGEIARYRLLETIRYYAAAQLARSGEDRVTRTLHRDHYLAFAEEAEGHLEGPGQSDWINRVATDYPNLRAAVTWSREQGQAEPFARIAAALNVFWMGHGPCNEGEAWFQDALAQTGHSATALRARTLCAGSWLACATWNLATAVIRAEEGLAAILVETDRRTEALEAADSLQRTAQEAGMPMFDVQVALVPAFRTCRSGFRFPSFGVVDDGNGECFEFGDEGA
jgi:hypothetical protein